MGRRGMVDMIYNEDYYLLLHKIINVIGPFREEDFFFVFLIQSL